MWKHARAVAQVGVALLLMQRQRIINLSSNFALGHFIAHLIANGARHAHHILIVNVAALVQRWIAKRQSARVHRGVAVSCAGVLEEGVIPRGVLLARRAPSVQMTQFHGQNRCLQRVQAAVHSNFLVEILWLHAVIAQTLHARAQFIIVGGNDSAVAKAT